MKSEALDAPPVSVSPQVLISMGTGKSHTVLWWGGGLLAIQGEEAVHMAI